MLAQKGSLARVSAVAREKCPVEIVFATRHIKFGDELWKIAGSHDEAIADRRARSAANSRVSSLRFVEGCVSSFSSAYVDGWSFCEAHPWRRHGNGGLSAGGRFVSGGHAGFYIKVIQFAIQDFGEFAHRTARDLAVHLGRRWDRLTDDGNHLGGSGDHRAHR